MASFDITVDGACKGKSEDIANMKKRFSAILEDQDNIDDPNRLRELFGDELGELGMFLISETPHDLDVDDEDSRNEIFGELRYDWGNADAESLQFSGDGDDDDPGGAVMSFLSAVKRVFHRMDFHFISWCYTSSGDYTIYCEGDEDEEEYSWSEDDGGEDKKDAYIEWRLAYRRAWLLGDDAPEAEREAAKKAEDDAEANFLEKLD